jgi:hypothetical protein
MMGLNLRKIVVGSIALGVLAGVFALYLRFNRTPPIVVDQTRLTPRSVAEANSPDSTQQVGTMAGIKVGPVQRTEFLHRNEFNQIDRKFGFEELLHEQGNQWEIRKPYMWMYLDRFVCRVTADRGKAQLAEAFGRMTPTDATFMGNVVIHVLPTDSNDSWECFILLDDVGFIAEKSMFSSTGAVRFLSHAMRLTGVGMELLYDGPRSRLELFRVFDLDSLRIRSSEVEAMASEKKGDSLDRDQDDSAATGDSSETASATGRTPAPADAAALPADVYQCVFRKNVRLNSPDGVAVARDVLAINGIQWARAGDRDSKPKQVADPNGKPIVPLPVPNALNTAASSYLVMSSIPDELYDIVVTCDGGADITLLGGSPNLANASPVRTPEGTPAAPACEEIDASDRQQVVAQRIDFDFLTTDTTMRGPVAMKFLVAPDPNSSRAKLAEKPMPMTVAAQGAVRYLAAAKRILLEGGSTATLFRMEPNSIDEYRLAAPRLTLDLVVDPNSPDEMKVDLRKFVADAGSAAPVAIDPAAAPPVTVRMWRRAADKLLAEGTLYAHKLQYEANPSQLTVAGPGAIWLHNAVTIRGKDDPNATVEPCYAQLSNFDSLQYWAATNRIIAEDDSQQLVLDYFPLVDGNYPWTQIVAGHVEATLQEDARNQLELVSFVASQGIEYDSEVDHLNFVGSEMVYDRATSLITIQGDDLRPCRLNGALVDAIVVNPKTRKVETQIAGPSILQIRR